MADLAITYLVRQTKVFYHLTLNRETFRFRHWSSRVPQHGEGNQQTVWPSLQSKSVLKQLSQQGVSKQDTLFPLPYLTCNTVTLWCWKRALDSSWGIILISWGTISREAPLARVTNSSTTDGSNVKGEAMNITSSGVIWNRSLKTKADNAHL